MVDYKNILTGVAERLSSLREEEKEKLFHLNAEKYILG